MIENPRVAAFGAAQTSERRRSPRPLGTQQGLQQGAAQTIANALPKKSAAFTEFDRSVADNGLD
jgi:hypothetical protein